MKRTLSFVLALMMIVPILAALPVSAAYHPEGTVLYSADFAERYANGGFTAALDQSAFGIGVTPLKYGASSAKNGCYNNLTAEGLEFGSVKNGVTGFVVDTYDLTKHESYTISFDMKITTPATGTYLWFGFGYNGKTDTYAPYASHTNFRYNGGSKLLVNGGYTAGAEDQVADLWKDIVTNSSVVNYRFIVTNNRLTNVIVTCGDHTANFANTTNSNLDASTGAFGVTWRADESNTPAALLKNLTVTVGEEKVHDVDFAKLYTEKGFTTAIDAVSLASMGVGVINKTVGSTAPSEELSRKIKVQLTDQGYTVAGVNRNTVGAYLNAFDLTQEESYIISMDLKMDLPADGANAYLYFGFGYDETKASYETWASSTNLRWNGKSGDKIALLINKYNASDSVGAQTLWTETLTNKAMTNYQFVVENNKLVKVIVTCGATAVTYTATAAEQLDASKGTFGISLRTANDALNPGFTLKKVEVTAHIAPDAEPIVNILDIERVAPTEAEYDYEDSKATKYVDGYVLHYMDFSKVESFDQTGYFVTKDGEPYGFQIKNGVLDVITGSSNVNMLLTGNSIPKSIQEYTFSVTFRFVEPSEKYLVYIHGDTIKENNTASKGKNTCLRYSGVIDNAAYTSKYAEAQGKLLAAMQAGEWVTFTYTAFERETAGIVMECGGNTVKWIKSANTSAAEGFMGLMFGASSHIQVSTIQLVAGYNENYETLVWPEAEKALVQSVNAAAIRDEEPPIITDEPTAEPSVPTKEPTKESTKAPSEPTKEPVQSTAEAPKTEKKGCGASVTAGALAAILVLTAVPFLVKRRED